MDFSTLSGAKNILEIQQVKHQAAMAEGAKNNLRGGHKLSAEGIKEAAEKFESLFIYYIFKNMRKTVPEGGLFQKGFGDKIYTDMLDEEMAKNLARAGGIGLSPMIINQLGRNKSNNERIKGFAPLEGPNHDVGDENDLLINRLRGNSKTLSSLLTGFIWPLEGEITSPFGMRIDPITGTESFHCGVDIKAGEGSEILAARGGRVAFSGERQGFGNVVILDHGDGFTTTYAHNLTNLVEKGDNVEKGRPIALVGRSGRATGAHLHFEMRRNGVAVDPRELTIEY